MKTVEEARRDIDPALLAERLRYDETTGGLYWLEGKVEHFKTEKAMRIFNKSRAGKLVGDYDRGYLRATIAGKKYAAHRAAWAIYYGSWPCGQIDHIDGNTTNNRISNLRVVTASENQRNAAKKRNSTTRLMGVFWHKGLSKWTAYIGVGGKLNYLGSFMCFFEAVCARKSAELKFKFHENHGRKYFIHPAPAAIESTNLGIKVK